MATGEQASAQPQLLAYARILYRRKWTTVVVTVLATAAAFGFATSETPTYQASAQILIQSSPVQQLIGGSSSLPPNLEDDIAVLQGPGVGALVMRKIGTTPQVKASPVSNTDIIEVTASSTVPSSAADIANAYADAYVSYNRSETINNLLAGARVLESRIAGLQGQLSSLEAESAKATAATQADLAPQIEALTQQLSLLSGQLDDVQSSVALGFTGAQVLVPATTPTSPTSPRKLRDGLLGLGGGLVLGIALAFVRESLDDTLVTREEVDRTIPGLPVLGEIPYVSSRRQDTPLVASLGRPHSDAAEAYRTLRTSVQFLALERSLRKLQVTSPRTTDGKTTTIANLAVALVGTGQRVVMVDCDLRRPRIHELFGLSNEVGFTSVLLGDASLDEALQDVPGQPGLRLLASGACPPNPSELLASPRTDEILESLCRDAAIVIVDCPPVLPVTDAVALAPRMDATLVVVSSGKTSGKDLVRSVELLAQVDAPVVGSVLNGVQVAGRDGYRYTYRYQPYAADNRQVEGVVGGGVPSRD